MLKKVRSTATVSWISAVIDSPTVGLEGGSFNNLQIVQLRGTFLISSFKFCSYAMLDLHCCLVASTYCHWNEQIICVVLGLCNGRLYCSPLF